MSAQKKKILIVQYSQSGQLSRVVDSVTQPLVASAMFEITNLLVDPVKPYPFPWPVLSFFDVFPESVYLDPPALKEFNIRENETFDLIILAYQVWFLSPSLPITGFLKSTTGKRLLKGTPVVTLVGCRNMWVMAQNTVKQLLSACGARLVDNAVLIDQGSTLASFITTPRWLLTGKKDAFLGFPAAGISKHEISAAKRFGNAILYGLTRDMEKKGLSMLNGLHAVEVDIGLVQSEKAGYRSFQIWGKLLRLIGPQGNWLRRLVLVLYICFLIALIIIVVPVTTLLHKLTRPLFKRRYQQLKQEYELPSGSGTERMEEFKCRN